MDDDSTTLTSAYLDGQTTADERAQVEADPALMAEVERMRQVRAMLGATDTAPISVRERHLAAALGAWDRIPDAERSRRDSTPAGAHAAAAAGAASMSAPASLDRRRRQRRRSTRLLGVAAGLVLVLGAGVIAQDALSGNDDGTQDAVSDASADTSETDAGVLAELEERAADATFDDNPGEDSAAEESSPAEIAVAESTKESSIGSDEAASDAGFEVLSSPEQVALFASDAIDAPTGDVPPDAEAVITAPPADVDADAGTPPLCDLVDQLVGVAIYQTAQFDGEILIGIDNARGEAVAYREQDCALVARAPLPDR